jgi:hypothetical protein
MQEAKARTAQYNAVIKFAHEQAKETHNKMAICRDTDGKYYAVPTDGCGCEALEVVTEYS